MHFFLLRVHIKILQTMFTNAEGMHLSLIFALRGRRNISLCGAHYIYLLYFFHIVSDLGMMTARSMCTDSSDVPVVLHWDLSTPSVTMMLTFGCCYSFHGYKISIAMDRSLWGTRHSFQHQISIASIFLGTELFGTRLLHWDINSI